MSLILIYRDDYLGTILWNDSERCTPVRFVYLKNFDNVHLFTCLMLICRTPKSCSSFR